MLKVKIPPRPCTAHLRPRLLKRPVSLSLSLVECFQWNILSKSEDCPPHHLHLNTLLYSSQSSFSWRGWGVTWGHVVFECRTTKTRPCWNSSLLVHFLGLAGELPCQEKNNKPGAFHKASPSRFSLYGRRRSCTHEHTQQADVHGDGDRKMERRGEGGDTGRGSGTARWRVEVCQKSNLRFTSLFSFCLLLHLPSLLYLLWRSLISCRSNVDFILELGV